MGLRRGFIQAGAQNLFMTLWPINDEVSYSLVPRAQAPNAKVLR